MTQTIGQFARVPARVAADRKLNGADLRVYIAIALHADCNGRAYPSLDRIASLTGIARNNLCRSVARLVARGHLRQSRRKGETGAWANSVYQIVFDGSPELSINGAASPTMPIGIPQDPRTVKKEAMSKQSIENSQEIAKEMLAIWSAECGDILPVPQSLEQDRVIHCHTRFRDSFGRDMGRWRVFVREIRASSFLCGEKVDWKATFDWSLRPANIRKVREGNYRDQPQSAKRNGTYDVPPLGPGGT